MQPFHLAFPVTSLAKARAFYGDLLGCPEGRSSDDWVDFNFYGHQIVAHLSPNEAGHHNTSAVDGDNVPVRHFGMVSTMPKWRTGTLSPSTALVLWCPASLGLRWATI